jgi:hypothetical protein
MERHPITLLLPLFDWLDSLIDQYGLYVYLVIWWLTPFLIAWILSGGFWRRPYRPRVPPKPRPVAERRAPIPPKLKSGPATGGTDDSDADTQAFSA